MSEALIIRDDARLSVAFTAEARAQRQQALEVAAMVGRVSNPDENAAAVEAQKALKAVIDSTEKARKEAKEPVLDYGRTIDRACKTHVAELVEEMTRVSTLVGDYQTLEQEKARAAERAKNEALTQMERERAAAVAQAPSHEAVDAINEVYAARAAELPVHEPARAQGQRISEDWDITISNVWDLARSHPTCVKIEPRLSEIKSLLNAGVKVAGVKAQRITKASVRVSQAQKCIEV